MATPAEAVRTSLAVVATTATAELLSVAEAVGPEKRVTAVLEAVPLVVPPYYDAAGTLAALWYDERRAEAKPRTVYSATIIGDPETDWIEREAAKFRRATEGDLEIEMRRMVDEVALLAEKEVARGFRDTVLGNTRSDADAIGWSRVAGAGACKLCTMIAARGAVFREETAHFATHKSCHCAARPEFRNGEHGPEATATQYLATSKRRTAAQNAQLRTYLNENYPDARG